ncbi:MAG: ABC transporter permease [Bifidobacteriaceae bacterium]|jgi:oligopeptide transport system permease protein|nr:ABC transporter permease [Bifidobacteriaceae bacterium]
MGWYLGRRVLQAIPVFLGATFLLYLMVFLLPGDPIAAMCGERGCAPAVETALRARYHLDQPFLTQYLLYLKGLLTGDLGVAYSGRAITEVIATAYPVTIKLAVMAMAFETIFGVAAGLVAGLRRGGIFDGTVLVLSLLVIALPTFVIGFVAQFVVGVQLGWLPTTVGANQSFMALLMPAMVLAGVSLAYVLRLTRTSVSENASADYVRTATAKGLTRSRVVTVHILRNSLIPVVTFVGADLGVLMGGAIVTEGIFSVPGVGNTLYMAILKGEGPTVVSMVTLLVIVFIITNLLVDVLYALIDPRIRYV